LIHSRNSRGYIKRMKRKLLLVLAFIALPGFANALGLGKLQLNSALNQPFDARIELLSASADEIDSLNIGLADSKAFRRARIDRPFILSKLKFKLKEVENGNDYIQISSRDAIREPFLNFLLEAAWSSGRLYREYTVLLDPPLYDPNANRSGSTDSYSPSSSSTPGDSYITDDDDSDSSSVSASSGLSYSDNEYGPTSGSDTLWSIATQVRPDNSVSVQQMMLALLRANPDAFVNGNINGLKRGQILNIPERDEIDSLSSQDAISDVKSQNSSWQETRGMLAESVTDRAESMPAADDIGEDSSSEDSSAMIEDDESELRLVAASSDGAGLSQGAGESADDSSASLALANEQFEVVSQENAELKDRMMEAETIIEDLKRLISLKDDELAALQQQMATGGMPAEEAEEMEVMVEAEEEFVEEVDDEEVAEDVVEEEVYEEEAVEEDDMMSEATDEDVIEEGLVSEEVEEVDEEAFEDEEELAMEEEVVADPVETAPPAGMLDQVLGFITGNLILIGGALGGIIIVIIALLFISRRRQNAAIEPASAAITEFPDFDESASEPEAASPEADADIDMSEEETLSPDSDEDEGKTEFVSPPEPQVEEAAPEPEPEAEEPEEDPLAEVNVFLAYEHFDQAEEFVREAITGNPDNLDFHAKLLEVFYAANDLKGYEDAAQVLHDKVNGEGQHWEMAQAMWQEMSPSRALFEEGGDDVAAAAPAADAAGGIMDITAEESEAEGADASVDFDLGMDTGAEPAATEAEDVLDITASGDEEDLLDVTAAAGVDGSSSDEDLLDVTAAVGLDTEEFAEAVESIAAEDEEPMLDITGGAGETAVEESAAEEDVLDISLAGGEDLLDVTANANLEADGLEEDLLDVTSSVGAEADGEELLEIPAEESAGEDDNALDFDIGGMDVEPEATAEADGEELLEIPAEESAGGDDNALDFDIGGMDVEPEATDEVEPDVSLDETGGDDNALDFDIGGMEEEVEADDDGGIELDLSTGDDLELSDSADEAADDSNEISIDDLEVADEDLEIDLSIDESDDSDSLDIGDLEMDTNDAELGDDLEIDLTLDDDSGDAEAESLDDDLEMDFDLEIEEDADVPEIDMDGTMEMPKADLDEIGMDLDDDDDDEEEEDHTVFVPRAAVADEQTAEDEIATKLDLAKAYVELGDKDSAKGILDEVMADGNEEQKRTAQDLISQLD
jgi:pilus assembly protein FimV